MSIKRIHHAAYRCNDADETVTFYRDLLDMDFKLAIAEDKVPSTGEEDPYMHVFMDAGMGNVIAFFELPNSPAMGKDQNTPAWVQHIAFEVDSMEVLGRYHARLEAAGVDVLGPVNHGIFDSIYFFDPNGHRLELTTPTCSRDRLAMFEQEAPRILSLWNETHDWSRREEAFGAREGYAWNKLGREGGG